MHMKKKKERRFKVSLTRDQTYRFVSQASEDERLHGEPYSSDEPDPVGDASGPATPALLGSAIGHCLSASLLERLLNAKADVIDFKTDAIHSDQQRNALMTEYQKQLIRYKNAVTKLLNTIPHARICFLDDQGEVSLMSMNSNF